MPDQAIIEAVLLVVLLWVIVDRGPSFLHAAEDLGIGLFQPWRGDPWPRGVQEDDDARFDWTPRTITEGPVLDVVIEVAADADPSVIDSWTGPTPWIEDEPVTRAPVMVQRPEHVKIRGAGR